MRLRRPNPLRLSLSKPEPASFDKPWPEQRRRLRMSGFFSTLLLLAVLAAGCAPDQPRPEAGGETPRAASPKRMIAAITGDPHTFSNRLNPGTNVPGIDIVEHLLNVGLAVNDDRGVSVPRLAEAIPTIENGLWKTFPDGRMEVTWRLRAGVEWHDGHSFTSEDLVFTARLGQDRDLPRFRSSSFDLVEAIETPDARTIVVKWKGPFVDADGLFNSKPLAKHILESPYLDNKSAFEEHPYFAGEYVGTGPFKLREWVRGSHAILQAHDRYVLGRPKIDQIEVKFIPDQNTLLANVLSGVVELVMSRGLSLDQGLTARDQWKDGRMEAAHTNWVAFFPQFVNTNPPVMLELRFRRALLHAIDRQQLAESIYAGLVSVAHGFFSPTEAIYPRIEAQIVRYEHDPRQAARLIEDLGYARGPEGFYRDSSGHVLTVPVRSSQTRAERTQMLLAILDAWQRVGVKAEPDIVPPQLVGDSEYRATFAAIEFVQNPNTLSGMKNFHSSNAPLPESRFVGSNRGRYRNPEMDSIVDRYLTTIPLAQRVAVVGEFVRHMSEQLPALGVVYGMDTMLIANRLRNVRASSMTWNAHEWDIG